MAAGLNFIFIFSSGEKRHKHPSHVLLRCLEDRESETDYQRDRKERQKLTHIETD